MSKCPAWLLSWCPEINLEKVAFWWEIPTVTVVADSKKRVTIRVCNPGDRFDVQQSPDGKVILTPLVPESKPNTIRLEKRHGYTVAVGRKITQAEVRKALDEFP